MRLSLTYKIPENVLQEETELLTWHEQALARTEGG